MEILWRHVWWLIKVTDSSVQSKPPEKVTQRWDLVCSYFILFFSILHLGPRQEDSPLSPASYQVHPTYPALQTQVIFIHMKMSGVGSMGREREREREVECETEPVDERTSCAFMNDLGHTRSQRLSDADFRCCWKCWNLKGLITDFPDTRKSVCVVQITRMWHSAGANHAKTKWITGVFLFPVCLRLNHYHIFMCGIWIRPAQCNHPNFWLLTKIVS